MNWLFAPGTLDELVEDIYMHTLTLAIFAAIPPWTDAALAAGSTAIRPAHLMELRVAVVALE